MCRGQMAPEAPDEGDEGRKAQARLEQYEMELQDSLRLWVDAQLRDHRAAMEASFSLKFQQHQEELQEVSSRCTTLVQTAEADIRRAICQVAVTARDALEDVDAALQCELARDQRVVAELEKELAGVCEALGITRDVRSQDVAERRCDSGRRRRQHPVPSLSPSLPSLREDLQAELREIRADAARARQPPPREDHGQSSSSQSSSSTDVPERRPQAVPSLGAAVVEAATPDVVIYEPPRSPMARAARATGGSQSPSPSPRMPIARLQSPSPRMPMARPVGGSHSPAVGMPLARLQTRSCDPLRTGEIPQSPAVIYPARSSPCFPCESPRGIP